MSSGPLNGFRVLDFGQGVAGPYCAQLLADHGADVIKIEPSKGDWSRGMGISDGSALTATYLAVNRNKRGICVDLKRTEALAMVKELVETCDVVVESFRPGVMERLGLGVEALMEINERLVFCSISGFGAAGPKAREPAGDSIMQAYGGLMSVVGEEGGSPLRVGNVVSDMVAGTNAFSGIILALLARGQDGLGRRVSTCLLDSMVAFQAAPISEYLTSGIVPRRPGSRHPLIAPSGVYETRDGHVMLTVLAHQWARFCAGLGLDDIVDDERFVTSNARQQNRAALDAVISDLTRGWSRPDMLAKLTEIDVLCSPINDYESLLREDQVRYNELIRETSDGSRLPMIANPVQIEGFSTEYGAPPRLGEDNRTVLSDVLGWDGDKIDAFLVNDGLT